MDRFTSAAALRRTRSLKAGLQRRSGTVLVFVLVVVMVLSCAAYLFADLMLAEAEAAAQHASLAQARAQADSGVELIRAVLDDRRRGGRVSLDDPRTFRDVVVDDVAGIGGQGFVSIFRPAQAGVERRPASPVYGMADESARLNPHGLPLDKDNQGLARRRLLALPGMTPAIAEAILDWLDDDDELRAQGAERAYYSTVSPPYQPRNGPLSSLEELLQIRGVTPALLYGEGGQDARADGGVRPLGGAQDASRPLPWASLLTLHSAETNLRPDGRAKINLNRPELAALYDEVAADLGQQAAQFVIAYRLYGPVDRDLKPEDEEDAAAAARRRAAEQLGTGQLGTKPPAVADVPLPPEARSRGGFDLTRPATNRVNSMYDLIGARIQAVVNNEDKLLLSPWLADTSKIEQSITDLERVLTVAEGPALIGRINVGQAPREVLLTIPGVTPELASAIMALRGSAAVAAGSESAAGRPTTAWLLKNRVLDLVGLRRIGPYINAGGDVYRARVVGHFAQGRTTAKLEVIVDATTSPPRIVHHRDLLAWRDADEF